MDEEQKTATLPDPSTISADEDPVKQVCSTPEEAEIGARLLPVLTGKIAAAADAKYSLKYRVQFDELQAANRTALEKAIADLRETMKPLTDEELNKLLSQEYGTFTVNLAGPNGPTTYTLRELPNASERKILTAVRGAIGPVLKLISSVEWSSLAGASQLERLDKIIELVPGAMDVACACVAICLDPKGDSVSGEWVKDNLGLNRIMAILLAQISASRYRDFFSLGSRLFQQTRSLS